MSLLLSKRKNEKTVKTRPLKIEVSNVSSFDRDEHERPSRCPRSSVHNGIVLSKTTTECTKVEISLEIKKIERREISRGPGCHGWGIHKGPGYREARSSLSVWGCRRFFVVCIIVSDKKII